MDSDKLSFVRAERDDFRVKLLEFENENVYLRSVMTFWLGSRRL